MSSSRLDPIWPRRWRALHNAIDHASNQHKNTPYHTLLKALDNYGDHWFAYFYKGFGGQLDAYPRNLPAENIPRLDDGDTEFGPNFVMRAICNRVAYDLELVQRCARQRRGSPEQIRTLNLVDAWSMDLLRGFGDPPREGSPSLLRQIPHVISYFNPTAEIRLIPYANAIFIGIPYTAAGPDTRRDLLVVPHELAHYVYAHGELDGVPISKLLLELAKNQEPFIEKWIEELFADTFAIAATRHRAAVVHWAYTMIRDNPSGNRWKDSDTHPIDAVRTFIYLDSADLHPQIEANIRERRRILLLTPGDNAQLTYKTYKENGELDKTYDLEQLSNILSVTLQAVSDKVGFEPLPSVFEDIFEILTDTSSAKQRDGDSREQQPANLLSASTHLIQMISQLIRDPQTWYDNFDASLDPYAARVNSDAQPWLLQVHNQLQTRQPTTLILDQEELTAEEWEKVLFAGDWITKGPQTAPPVGAWEDHWLNSAIHQ